MWHINKFNIVASDKIPVNRTLMDVRKEACKGQTFEEASHWYKASVIIVFHNEA